MRDEEDIYVSVGFGRVSPKQIVHMFSEPKEIKPEDINKPQSKERKKSSNPFIIEGIDDVMVKIAKCCSPLPGEDVVGYISRGRGIVVHRVNCENLKNSAFSEERLVDVQWDEKKNYKMPVKLHASVEDRTGLLNALTTVLKDMGLNIVELSTKRNTVTGTAALDFSIEVKNKNELESVMRKIKTIEGMLEVISKS